MWKSTLRFEPVKKTILYCFEQDWSIPENNRMYTSYWWYIWVFVVHGSNLTNTVVSRVLEHFCPEINRLAPDFQGSNCARGQPCWEFVQGLRHDCPRVPIPHQRFSTYMQGSWVDTLWMSHTYIVRVSNSKGKTGGSPPSDFIAVWFEATVYELCFDIFVKC